MVLKLYHYFRHTVQLHLKEVIYLSKEIHNFFNKTVYIQPLLATVCYPLLEIFSKPVDRMAPMQLITVDMTKSAYFFCYFWV